MADSYPIDAFELSIIQKILAYSARQFDDGNTVWKENDAIDWNGGGLHFSEDYGFGIIDASYKLANFRYKFVFINNFYKICL